MKLTNRLNLPAPLFRADNERPFFELGAIMIPNEKEMIKACLAWG